MIAASPLPAEQERHRESDSPMIAVRSLTKAIGEQEILRGIDLEVATGETLVIIGRSGGGKSVLLKHLIGLMLPDAGEIWIEGQNIIGLTERQLAPIRRKVGILFQGAALFDSMTVEENIAFPLREAGERDENVIRKRVNEMLEVIELEGQQTKMPVNLSGGMKKRVGLARSIIRPQHSNSDVARPISSGGKSPFPCATLIPMPTTVPMTMKSVPKSLP